MKKRLGFIIFALLLAGCEYADASTLITFKDGSTQCNDYVAKNGTCCQEVSGGEMCFDKTEISHAYTVKDCPEPTYNGESATAQSLKESQVRYDLMTETEKRKDAKEHGKRDMQNRQDAAMAGHGTHENAKGPSW